jgi:Glycosyl hydrolase family 115
MRSTPNEFTLYGKGTWDYVNNADNIKQFWLDGAKRAKPFESVYTLGMRGFGDRKTIARYPFRSFQIRLFLLFSSFISIDKHKTARTGRL